jgi:hypothetical protein
MDPQTRGIVVATLRWLAAELQRDRHGLAHVPMELAAVVANGGPAAGCRRCGGPVEVVPRGRPRVTCERCRPPRTKTSQNAG